MSLPKVVIFDEKMTKSDAISAYVGGLCDRVEVHVINNFDSYFAAEDRGLADCSVLIITPTFIWPTPVGRPTSPWPNQVNKFRSSFHGPIIVVGNSGFFLSVEAATFNCHHAPGPLPAQRLLASLLPP
ncbi:MAG: hypothetical protein ABIA47_01395 [bacterium]